ncbi:VCBS domain-containing protein, partial [Vibrio amylolyticus]|uniref:VCBS domain-containing protein n=1 Tax=Vibrio amylolyticus TaxID=2847292 RepID=UPI00354EB3D7
VDTGEQVYKTPDSLEGEFGTFSFNINTGAWTYMLDPEKSDRLNAGDTETDSLRVTSFDGTATETITVNVAGSNDAASIKKSKSDDTSVTESGLDVSGDSSAGGKLKITDIDDGEALIKVDHELEQREGKYGTFTISSDGTWSYELDPDKSDKLNHGDAAKDKLVVESFDGTATKTIKVDILGSNDKASISGKDFGSVKEDHKLHESPAGDYLQAKGRLKVSDVDKGEARFDVTSVEPSDDTLGRIEITAGGRWTYQVDNADVQYLGKGDTKEETFTVSSLDGTATETITVTIKGTNDVPIATDDTYNVANETLLFAESFEEMTSTSRWTVVRGDNLGDWEATHGLEIQHDGLIAKATDGDYLAELDAHRNTSISTNVDISEHDSVRVEFDYNPRHNGGNSSSDMAFSVGGIVITVHADGTLSGTNDLNVQISEIDGNGWYRITGEFEATSDSIEISFSGSGKSDSYGALLDNISVTGIQQPNLTTEEDEPITISFTDLLGNDRDIDGDSLAITDVSNAQFGSLTVDYDSKTITFTPTKDYNGEATFEYSISDGNGGFDSATVTLNVTPVNDAPTIDLNGDGHTIHFESEKAEHSNVFGYFRLDEDGNPTDPQILILNSNSNDLSAGEVLAELDSTEGLQYFIISNGADTLGDNPKLSFSESGQLLNNDGPISKQVFLSTQDNNQYEFIVNNENGVTEIRVEDILLRNGGTDFNDLVVTLRPDSSDAGTGYTTTFT